VPQAQLELRLPRPVECGAPSTHTIGDNEGQIIAQKLIQQRQISSGTVQPQVWWSAHRRCFLSDPSRDRLWGVSGSSQTVIPAVHLIARPFKKPLVVWHNALRFRSTTITPAAIQIRKVAPFYRSGLQADAHPEHVNG